MQALTFACSVLFVILDIAQGQNQDDNGSSLYTRRYENLDVDTILASPRLVSNYVECLLNKKPCAPEGKALKRILPEALRTKCSRCWPSQKEGALKVITSLYYNYPQYYEALRKRWDPTGEYNRRFEEYIRDQKFNSIGSDTELGEQAQGSSVSINITQRPIRQDDVSPSVQRDELPEIANRFGTDGDSDSGYAYNSPKPSTLPTEQRPVQRPQTAQRPQATQRPQRPQQPPQPQQAQQPQQSQQPQQVVTPSRRPSNAASPPSSGGVPQPDTLPSSSGISPAPSNAWTQTNLPAPGISTTTTYYLKTQNPVLNIINRITMKFANTAEFIAGMLRGAVPVAPPKATKHKAERHRTRCDRLRKTVLSYKNTRTVTNHNHRH